MRLVCTQTGPMQTNASDLRSDATLMPPRTCARLRVYGSILALFVHTLTWLRDLSH